jgi:hypothetical protein
MITRTYQKRCDVERLESEILSAGFKKYPTVGFKYYSSSCDQVEGGYVTSVLLIDTISEQDITTIDSIVNDHIPTPLPVVNPPSDDDGKPYVRNEVRPLGKTAYFTSAGDDPVLGIGQGPRIDWDFADDPGVAIDSEYKSITIDVSFNESVNVRGGFLSYRNSADECMIDMGIVCPAGQYYLDAVGHPHLATTDVWVNRYVNKFDMDGNQDGLYIDGSTGSSDIPPNYKMRFQVTTKTEDVTSRGHVAIMMYRAHTVTFPS